VRENGAVGFGLPDPALPAPPGYRSVIQIHQRSVCSLLHGLMTIKRAERTLVGNFAFARDIFTVLQAV
jgi:hypothetical protein